MQFTGSLLLAGALVSAHFFGLSEVEIIIGSAALGMMLFGDR